jgi:PAS domain S-box-containing protein
MAPALTGNIGSLASLMSSADLPEIGLPELRRLLDRLAEGILWVDPAGRVLWLNRTALEILGCDEDECLGGHVSELPFEAGLAEKVLAQLRRGGTPEAVETLVPRGGDERRVIVETHPVHSGGKLSHSFWIARDVTEARRIADEMVTLLAQAEAARAAADSGNQLKDDFLAVLSHELRSPLAAILMWIRVLQQGQEQSDSTRRGLEVMERGARALERIIEDLLHVSRISAGKLTLAPVSMDLRPVAGAALDSAEADAQLKGVTLVRPAPGGPLVIEGDPGRVQQAIGNLLANAIKFTPSGGEVSMALEVEDGFVSLVVADNGRGMSPSFLPYAFDRFRQQDSSSTRTDHGLGLGLFIVRHVAELHGGHVTAESPGLDQGSRFTIRLPLSAGAGAVVDQATDPDGLLPITSLEGLHVLLVDDEPDTREALRMVLEQHGLIVATAGSADEAMARLDQHVPDLLLSDIAMPGEDGLGLIRRVRARPAERGGQVPAAAVTAYAGADDRRQALQAGFQHHVAKPVDPTRLLGIIATMARARRR